MYKYAVFDIKLACSHYFFTPFVQKHSLKISFGGGGSGGGSRPLTGGCGHPAPLLKTAPSSNTRSNSVAKTIRLPNYQYILLRYRWWWWWWWWCREVTSDGRDHGDGRRVDADRVLPDRRRAGRQVPSSHWSTAVLALRAQLPRLRTEPRRQQDQDDTAAPTVRRAARRQPLHDDRHDASRVSVLCLTPVLSVLLFFFFRVSIYCFVAAFSANKDVYIGHRHTDGIDHPTQRLLYRWRG